MTDTHHELPHAGSDEVAKVRQLIEDENIAMLTTVAEDGSLVSRPMGVQAVDFDGDLWFFAAEDSHKVAEIARDSAANAAFSGKSSWVSLSGRASLVHDPDKIRELWNAVADAWFPDGPDSPGVVLIRLHAESAEYWDSPGGRVATLFRLVTTKVTGKPYEGGENETVRL
ncbi:pyridoxamine 5'-phosphate oxidase family protein [Cellulosimicrobium sp. Marseille-Q4280]|jgi:general stress protein 26|uniref:pyridoxamine 5'-phosphate oxidase family protein n=1 Tax=Cellulosimicrobium sp. Marseille-Q4280 TaxID=2937992 RepID=UPI00203D4301|nr:pyridoxamine 5'-phosphate oxidase family protein [Cellulosimicrobium sp. Marseille-Q4280]